LEEALFGGRGREEAAPILAKAMASGDGKKSSATKESRGRGTLSRTAPRKHSRNWGLFLVRSRVRTKP